MTFLQYIFFISAVILLVYLYIKRKKRIDTIVTLNNMEIIFEKMNVTVLQNNLQNDSNIVNFLKAHKAIIINPEFADIRVIMAIKEMQKKKKANTRIINENNIPESLKDLSNQFSHQFAVLVKINMLEWGFLRLCLLCSTVLLFHFIFHVGNKIININQKLGNLITPQNQLIVDAMKGNNEKLLRDNLSVIPI